MPSGEFRALSHEEPRCEALAESLSAYVDGALAETMRQEVEAHVRACTTCAAELARLQRLCEELRDLVHVQPPAHVWDEVRDAAAAGKGANGTKGALGRVLTLIAEVLLRPFDGELAHRCRAEGTCRETESSAHGPIAVVTGLLLGLLTQGVAPTMPLWAIAVGLLLMWLASTRLEGRLSHRILVLTMLTGSLGPAAWELARAAGGYRPAPMALAAALAALAAAQAVTCPRLRPLVLGRFHVPVLARSCALVLLATAFARPDLVGLIAAVPPLAGAAGGAIAAWGLARRRAA